MIYLGIDPGLSGAVSAILPDGRLFVTDTPVAVVKKTRRDYLVGEMAAVLRGLWDRNQNACAALERGIAMPRQSSSTTYTTGRGGGLWEGILAALGIPYELVDSRKWKKEMGLPPGADKGASRVLASRLFPESAQFFARAKDDGRAESALIAEYRRRIG